MCGQIFKAMLITSCIGSAFAAVLLLLGMVTKKRFSSAWHYYMWISIMIIMLIPFRFEAPAGQTEVVRQVSERARYISLAVLTDIKTVPAAAKNNFEIAAGIWLGIVGLLFVARVGGFYIFMASVRKKSCPEISDFAERKVTVLKSEATASPFVTGVFFPVLVLPPDELTQMQLDNIIAHEMTHLHHGDILVKWLAVIVKCIHWFNPFVYVICSRVNILCEISCDLSVTRQMSEKEKATYVDTILSLIGSKRGNTPLTTAMASGKRQLFKRFMQIKTEKKMSRRTTVAAVVFSVMLISSAVFSSGMLSGCMNISYSVGRKNVGFVLPDIDSLFPPKSRVTEKTDAEPVMKEVLEEAVAASAVEADLPEVLPENIPDEPEDVQVEETEEEASHIAEAPEYVPEELPPPEPQENDYTGIMVYDEAFEEMNAEEVIRGSGNKPRYSGDGPVDLDTHYRSFEYNFDTATTITTEVYPDKHGNISIYFDSKISGVNASVNISKKGMNGLGWGYNVPTDSRRAYYFCNFEPDTPYDVTISSYCPGNYNINGNVLVY